MKHPRSITLPLIVGLILSAVYFLPKSGEMLPSAIGMDLPSFIDGWTLQKKPPSPEEIANLAKDTIFSKATCLKARDGEYDLLTGQAIPDRIDLSIVFSGHNLNDSIHRPERCMPAQGHTIAKTTEVTIPIADGKNFKVRRLLSTQSIPLNKDHTEYRDFACVTYYFFVGNSDITHDHYARTFLDMKDRLFLGVDQRWAYVSISMWYGDLPWVQKKIPLEEADSKIKEFISELGKVQIDWEMVR